MRALRLKFRPMFSQSIFLRLVASFLLIITLLSSLYLVSFNFFIQNIEDEIRRNASERLDNVVNKIDNNIYQIKNMMINITQEDVFVPITYGKKTIPYTQRLVIDIFKNYIATLDSSYCIDLIFVLQSNSRDYVITSESTYNTGSFFELFYNNEKYTEEFWRGEMESDFYYKNYPSSTFTEKSRYFSRTDINSYLLPIALKSRIHSPYMIVSLIDVKSLFMAVDKDFMNDFYILDQEHNLLYSTLDETGFTHDVDYEYLIDNSSSYLSSNSNSLNYTKTDEGYIFLRRSRETDLVYGKFLSNANIKAQLSKTNFIFKLITAFSIIASLCLSLVIVQKFNNPVKQIIEILKKSPNPNNINDNSTGNAVNLNSLKDNIQDVIIQNASYKKDLDSKNSLLESFKYYSHIKNIYPILKDQLDLKRSYILVYYKLHFKPDFYLDLDFNEGSATYYLTAMIELYSETFFKDTVTFQVENDQIVTVINIDDDIDKMIERLNDNITKLNSEERYVFFTAVVSKVYQDVSQLSLAYKNALEISEHRAPLAITQVLTESEFEVTSFSSYYFSSDQEEQLTNLLYNGRGEESVSLVASIIDHNFRKKVNCFYIRALCAEIVNCCVKVLTKTYYEPPSDMDFSGIYSQIKGASSIDDFKEHMKGFICELVKYMDENKKQDDYIIDNIVDYIQEYYFEDDLSVDMLSEKLSLTSNYVSAYFKSKMGINLNEYINNVRIGKSTELLESTSEKVKDISEKVGFSNVNTFIRVFKKQMGTTPTDYKKQLL